MKPLNATMENETFSITADPSCAKRTWAKSASPNVRKILKEMCAAKNIHVLE
jgi:hypothetical protein